MDDFTIATLTCNDRTALFDVIKNVFSYTNFPSNKSLKWTIYAQGCSQTFIDKIRELFSDKPCTLNLIINPVNEGYSRGMNAVWNAVNAYKFVLFLEDDWILTSGANKDWLITSLNLMSERSEIDIVYLRRYLTDAEKWQYGWRRHIPYRCFEGRLRFNYEEQMKNTIPFQYGSVTFQQIPNFMYTANPCIYRTDTYKKCKVFPMIEFNDAHNERQGWNDSSKLNAEWGYAEALSMEKTADCFVLYLDDGIFYHNVYLKNPM